MVTRPPPVGGVRCVAPAPLRRLCRSAGVRRYRCGQRGRCEGTSVLYWLLQDIVLGPALKVIFRPGVAGLHHVPAAGPAILACNHLSFVDSIFLPLVVRRRVTYVAKAEYFTGGGLKGRLMKAFFAGTGTIPVDRSGGEAA